MATRRKRTGRGLAIRGVVVIVTVTIAVVAISALTNASPTPSAVRFVVKTNPFTVGQAPDWLDERHVVYQATGPDGDPQVFRSTLSGAEKTCLTCGLGGPNQVPVVQPHGRWILFHSSNGHAVRIGSPGFGGLGSDVWVMRRDGRRRTNLTESPEFHDNFHAYWSPDGHYIVWTALNWNADEGGNGKSDIRVARFDPSGPRGPRLVDEHRVRPGNGHWYETQWWAPDGSGFLYTESVDTALNNELFFCRLPDPARGMCRPQRLTNNPAWDEQAIFTPDMDRIIFMSTRDHEGAFNNWTRLATLLDLPAKYDYALVLQVFSEGFLQPVFQQADDLYQIDLRWNQGHTRFHQRRPVRRLTHSGGNGWIIPEFAWDPDGRRLLWTQGKLPNRIDEPTVLRQIRRDIVGRLKGVDRISEIPFDIVSQVRDRVGKVLVDPDSFGSGDGPSALVQRTVIGRYLRLGP
jgi:Tol biopolymer transport system component